MGAEHEAADEVLALTAHGEVADRRTCLLYGSSGLFVNVTPEPDSRLRLPNTMRCTTTAVPHSSATPMYWR